MEISGLPLHPLVVHAVVVLLPLTAIALVVAQLSASVRRRLGLLPLVGAVAVAILVPVTIAAGMALAQLVGPLPAVQAHGERGSGVLPWALALPVVAAGQWAWFRWGRDRVADRHRRRARLMSAGVGVLVCAVSAGAVVAVVLAGDSGSRAVWGSLTG
ncbi:DUF2231 domain-containing protein [Microbacterium rhizophilus]|uniref:DUF2231 domain-containing protein n=1 Tax=Microbacterium rhizophilus TaxID=3138934 RepID=UPI0031E6D4FE